MPSSFNLKEKKCMERESPTKPDSESRHAKFIIIRDVANSAFDLSAAKQNVPDIETVPDAAQKIIRW